MEALSASFQSIVEYLLDYALILAATGALAMALVDAVKALIKGKALYHEKMLKSWLSRQLPEIDDSETQLLETCREMEELCSGEHSPAEPMSPIFALRPQKAFYSLDTPQLTRKVQSSFEAVLHQPIQYPHLFGILASFQKDSAHIWRNYLEQVKKHADNPEEHQSPTKEERETAGYHQDLLVELLNHKLDTFQINTLYAWGRLNRSCGMLLGAIVLFLLLSEQQGVGTMEAVVFSAFGGAISPLAKNLVIRLRGIELR